SDSLSDVAVTGWVYNNRHRWVVLGSSTDHGWTDDINLLDATIGVCARSDSLCKWVQGNHDAVEGVHRTLSQLIQVTRRGGISQNARMHAWVQGLNAAFEALWESGERFNRSDVNTKISNLGGGGAGGHNLYACAVKRASELFEPCLVINAN